MLKTLCLFSCAVFLSLPSAATDVGVVVTSERLVAEAEFTKIYAAVASTVERDGYKLVSAPEIKFRFSRLLNEETLNFAGTFSREGETIEVIGTAMVRKTNQMITEIIVVDVGAQIQGPQANRWRSSDPYLAQNFRQAFTVR